MTVQLVAVARAASSDLGRVIIRLTPRLSDFLRLLQ
jgi:hypothetical protein